MSTSSINTHNVQRRGINRLRLSIPFIYSMIIPAAILHVWTQFYQHTAFRLYGIPRIDSSKFIKDRRRKLSYLSWSEKFNCWYCTYANGVFAFASAVARETEKMWCPIKNAAKPEQPDLPHRKQFADYGNEDSLSEYLDHSKQVPPIE